MGRRCQLPQPKGMTRETKPPVPRRRPEMEESPGSSMSELAEGSM